MSDRLKRRVFTEEFKNDAVKLVVEQGYTNNEVGRRLGIHGSNVSRWVREYRNGLQNPAGTPNSPRDMEAEIKRLKKENKRLLMEREILKKAAAFFANESK